VVPGAEMPLANTPALTAAWEQQHGKLIYNGAWDLARPGRWADPRHVRDLPEGNPSTASAAGPAADFIVRLARAHPGEISLWCAAPFTNLALALQREPQLPALIRELHFMGGAFAPGTEAREFRHTPRREFNFRFDPEATRAVLRAPWRRVTCSPIDVSQPVRATAEMFAAIARCATPLARYLDRFGLRGRPMWDEVAAATWIDESLVTRYEDHCLDVELDRGPNWGDTLSWSNASVAEAVRPSPSGIETLTRSATQTTPAARPARVQMALDAARFHALFIELCSR
jgi:inosine-uridine nucleoside N-ribohydrolase